MAFNLFGKKEDNLAGHIFIDRAYVSTAAKMNACMELAKKEPDHLFISWFADTARKFKEFFIQHGIDENRVTEARYIHTPMLQNKVPVFVEHHPLHAKELELIKNWDAKNIIVFSALDEPLFKHFGSDKVIPMMKMLGMKESEAIEHNLVSKSIIKGQEKIAGLVSLEQPANSQAEWMEKNIK
ncbi:MAG: hypothetical protein ABI666_11590 [Ferruginibacter sp.]